MPDPTVLVTVLVIVVGMLALLLGLDLLARRTPPPTPLPYVDITDIAAHGADTLLVTGLVDGVKVERYVKVGMRTWPEEVLRTHLAKSLRAAKPHGGDPYAALLGRQDGV